MSGTTASGTQNTPASWTSARNSSASWAKSLKVYVSTCHPEILPIIRCVFQLRNLMRLGSFDFLLHHAWPIRNFTWNIPEKPDINHFYFLQIPNSMLRYLLFVRGRGKCHSTLPLPPKKTKKTPSPLFLSGFASSAFRMECVNCNTWNSVMPGYRLLLWSWALAGHAVAWCVASNWRVSKFGKVKKQMEQTMPNILGLETKLFTTVSS